MSWAPNIVVILIVPCIKEAVALLIPQPLRHFTYITADSTTLPSLYLHHSSFHNPSVASPTSQFALQPSFASPTSQDFHLVHLASRPCPLLQRKEFTVFSLVSAINEIAIISELTRIYRCNQLLQTLKTGTIFYLMFNKPQHDFY